MKRWGILLVFVLGVAVGVAGTIWGPELAAPYLPEALRGKAELVEGEVVRKQREGERLLLTVVTPQGATLASFRAKVAEIELLVDEGDRVTLALSRYQPFLEDPRIEGVRKPQPEKPSG